MVSSVGEQQDSNHPSEESATAAIVHIRVGLLRLLEHSHLLLPEFDTGLVFVEWNFLDIQREQCRTNGTLSLPRNADEHVDFGQERGRTIPTGNTIFGSYRRPSLNFYNYFPENTKGFNKMALFLNYNHIKRFKTGLKLINANFTL